MSPRVNDTSTSVNQGLFSPRAKATILQELDRLTATFPAEARHTVQVGAWFAHESLVARNIQHENMIDPHANIYGLMNDAVVDETYNLRSEAIHWWNIIGSGFKSYWMRWITPAHREIILLSAFYGTYKTPRGEEYAKYLLDFSIPQLLENNGGKLIAFIENVIQRGIMELDASVPPLNDELDQTISHWIAELDDKNEYGRYKGDNIMCLKAMIHFSRATFAMRFTSQVMELWQVISGEFSADLVSEANPLGIKNNFDGTFSVARTTIPSGPQGESKKPSKKKGKKSHRGKNGKALYQVRKKEAKAEALQIADTLATVDESTETDAVTMPLDSAEEFTLHASTEISMDDDMDGDSEATMTFIDEKDDVIMTDPQEPWPVDASEDEGCAYATAIVGDTDLAEGISKVPGVDLKNLTAVDQQLKSDTPDRFSEGEKAELVMGEPCGLVHDEKILSTSGDASTVEEHLATENPFALSTHKPRNNLWENLELRQWRSQHPEVPAMTDKKKEDAAAKLQIRRELTKARIRDTPWVHSGMRAWYARSSWGSLSGSPEALGMTAKVVEDAAKDAAPVPTPFKMFKCLWNPSAFRQENTGRFGSETPHSESQKDFLERHQGVWDNLVPEDHNLSQPEYEDLMAIPGSLPVYSSSSSSKSSSGSESGASVYVDAKLFAEDSERYLYTEECGGSGIETLKSHEAEGTTEFIGPAVNSEIAELDDDVVNIVATETDEVPDFTGIIENIEVDEAVVTTENSDLTESVEVPNVTGIIENIEVDEAIVITENSDLTETVEIENVAHSVESDRIVKVCGTQTSGAGDTVEAVGATGASKVLDPIDQASEEIVLPSDADVEIECDGASVETDLEMLQTPALGHSPEVIVLEDENSNLVDDRLLLASTALIPNTAVIEVQDRKPHRPSKVYIAIPHMFWKKQIKPSIVMNSPGPDVSPVEKAGRRKKSPRPKKKNRANKKLQSVNPSIQNDTTAPPKEPEPPRTAAKTDQTVEDVIGAPTLVENQPVAEVSSQGSSPILETEHTSAAGTHVVSLTSKEEPDVNAVYPLVSKEELVVNAVSDASLPVIEKLHIVQGGSEVSLFEPEKESAIEIGSDDALLIPEKPLVNVEVELKVKEASGLEEPKCNHRESHAEPLAPSTLEIPTIIVEEHHDDLTIHTEKYTTGPTISAQGFYIEDPNATGEGLQEGPGFADRVRILLSKSSPSSSLAPSRQDNRNNNDREDCSVEIVHGKLSRSSGGQYAQRGGSPSGRGGRGGRYGQNRQRIRGPKNNGFLQAPNEQRMHWSPANPHPHQFGPYNLLSQQCSQSMAPPPGLTYSNALTLPYQPQVFIPPWYNGTRDVAEHRGTAYHISGGDMVGYFGFPKIPLELLSVVKDARLGSLKFQCFHCRALLTHENSVVCLICGVNSATRFCDDRCRYADGGHWQFCGLDGLPYRTDYHPPMYSGPLRTRGNANVYLYWQTTVLHDYPGFDYIVFGRGFLRNQPPHIFKAVVFGSQTLRNRFHAVLKRAVWDFDRRSVLLLFRVVRHWARKQGWVLPEGVIEDQFEMEFGSAFAEFRHSYFPDSMPSEYEWREHESHLGGLLLREGFPGMAVISTKLPLVGQEPKVPGYILDRMEVGAAPTLDV